MPGGVRTTQQRERDRNVGVAINEAAIVVAQPDEAAQLDIGRRGWPISDGGDLARVHRHASTRDSMTQEAQLLTAEGALGSLDVELLLPQYGEHLPHVAKMLSQRRAIAQEVIHVHHHRQM